MEEINKIEVKGICIDRFSINSDRIEIIIKRYLEMVRRLFRRNSVWEIGQITFNKGAYLNSKGKIYSYNSKKTQLNFMI